MLDFPELLAPANNVNGAIFSDCSQAIDLKPLIVTREMESRPRRAALVVALCDGVWMAMVRTRAKHSSSRLCGARPNFGVKLSRPGLGPAA